MATDEELRRVYNIFTDVWKFYRKYADVQQSDEYWKSLVDETEAITKKHQNSKLCRDLILVTVRELERATQQN